MLKANPGRVSKRLPAYYSGRITYMEVQMDIQVIGQLVASLGFPIVAAAALFWFINKQEERHKEEMDGVRKTLEENTSVLASLKDLIQLIINKENK